MKSVARLVPALLVAVLAALSPAAGDITGRGYALPKGGGYPHDVAVAADGVVWYTAQRDGALGRLPARGASLVVELIIGNEVQAAASRSGPASRNVADQISWPGRRPGTRSAALNWFGMPLLR